MKQIFKNKLPMVKNPWFYLITLFGFGFQSERSRKYVFFSLHPWIGNPQFSRSENKSSGQTLIEIIIAIAVGTLIITAILALATRSNRNSNLARASTQASKLAEGGLEIIKSIQDINADGAIRPDPSSANTESWVDFYADDITDGQKFLLFEPDTAVVCTLSRPSWCLRAESDATETENINLDNQNFTREVFISDDPSSVCNLTLGDHTRLKQFSVVVTWTDPVGEHEQRVVTCIRR